MLCVSLYCSDNRIVTGNDFPFRNVSEIVYTNTIYPTKSEVLEYHKEVGYQGRLLLGEAKDYSSSILLRFDVQGTYTTVKRAVVSLTPYSIVGDASGSFEGVVYKITSNWNELETPDVTYDLTEIGTFTVEADASEMDSIEILPSIVEEWNADSTSNYGIMISFRNADFIKRYYSFESYTSLPELKLTVEYEDEDEDKTEWKYTTMDTYLYTSSAVPKEGELIVDDLSIYRSIIKFDSIGIPENATINKAVLEMYLKTEESQLIKSDIDLIYAMRITNDLWNPDELEYEEEDIFRNQQYSNFIDDEIVRINITGITQQWTAKMEENHGLLLKSANEALNAGKYVFPLDSLVQGKRFKLLIDYSYINVGEHF